MDRPHIPYTGDAIGQQVRKQVFIRVIHSGNVAMHFPESGYPKFAGSVDDCQKNKENAHAVGLEPFDLDC